MLNPSIQNDKELKMYVLEKIGLIRVLILISALLSNLSNNIFQYLKINSKLVIIKYKRSISLIFIVFLLCLYRLYFCERKHNIRKILTPLLYHDNCIRILFQLKIFVSLFYIHYITYNLMYMVALV